VRPHPTRRGLSVTFRDCLHDALMLLARTTNAFALPQLSPAKGAEPRADVLRLLGKFCWTSLGNGALLS
jgi:hypothetical protein